tara:strand:+ start:697 stop:1518 length:822 start_codon:yes stop_codon:yes gene_type:complete
MKKKIIYFLSFIFPWFFSNIAYNIIKNPSPKKSKIKSQELKILNKANQKNYIFNNYSIKIYTWGKIGKKILLIHGWEGQTGNFSSIIKKLLKKNHSIYAFDAPSHGFSGRSRNTMADFNNFLSLFIKKTHPDIIITHSFGAVPTTYSLIKNKNLLIKKLILFAPPNKFSDRIDDIINTTGVSKKIKKYLIKKIEYEYKLPFETLNISNFINKINVNNTLILHDINDKICSVNYANEIHEKLPNSKLEILKNTGHSKILRDNIAINKVIDFIDS